MLSLGETNHAIHCIVVHPVFSIVLSFDQVEPVVLIMSQIYLIIELVFFFHLQSSFKFSNISTSHSATGDTGNLTGESDDICASSEL